MLHCGWVCSQTEPCGSDASIPSQFPPEHHTSKRWSLMSQLGMDLLDMDPLDLLEEINQNDSLVNLRIHRCRFRKLRIQHLHHQPLFFGTGYKLLGKSYP